MPVGAYAGANVSNGNGVTTLFPYNFKILDQTHIEVKVDGVLKVLGADYTVSGVGLSNGGNVVFGVAPANGAVVQRARKVPYTRAQDYQVNGDFKEVTVDTDLDLLEMQVQQLAADAVRAFKAPISVTADQVLSDAGWALRAGKFLAFDGGGNLILSTGGLTGVAVESVQQVVASVAALKAMAIPAAPVSVFVLGYYAALDLGGGSYYWDAASVAADNGGTVIRPASLPAAGRWRLKTGDGFSVGQFGAKGDGATDDAAAINAAIAEGILRGRKVTFAVPSVSYKILSPLFVYSAAAFISVALVGEEDSGRNDRGVVIDHSTILDKPAIIVQGARTVEITGLQGLGPNTTVPATWFTAAEWDTVGVRDSRYSPQCFIAIDPFKNGAPADGGYPGLAAYYTANALASNRVRIRNIRAKNQLVGVMVGPTGLAANADEYVFENIKNEQVKYPIALGQIMPKGCAIKNLFADQAYVVVDTYTYGSRDGACGFHWTGGDVTRSAMLVKHLAQNGAANATTEVWSVRDVYAESIHTIGFIGDAETYSYVPGTFDDCTFWFSGGDVQRYDANYTGFGPVTFRNCLIVCNYSAVDTTLTRALKFYHASPTNRDQRNLLRFENCRGMGDWGILFNTDNLDNIVMDGWISQSPFFRYSFSEKYKVRTMADITLATAVWPGALIDDAGTGDLIKVAQGMNAHVLGGAIAFTKLGFTGTFVAPDANTLQVFDAVYITNHPIEKIDGTTFNAAEWPLGTVSIAAGVNITLRDISKNASTGNKAMTLRWYPRQHGPCTVTTINANPAIVIAQGGVANAWNVGERIISANIPSGSYITVAAHPNYTISKNASAGAAGTRCYDANASLITKVAY